MVVTSEEMWKSLEKAIKKVVKKADGKTNAAAKRMFKAATAYIAEWKEGNFDSDLVMEWGAINLDKKAASAFLKAFCWHQHEINKKLFPDNDKK